MEALVEVKVEIDPIDKSASHAIGGSIHTGKTMTAAQMTLVTRIVAIFAIRATSTTLRSAILQIVGSSIRCVGTGQALDQRSPKTSQAALSAAFAS